MGTCRGTGRYSPFGRQTYGLGGGPREALPPTVGASARAVGRVRLVDAAACEGRIDIWDPDEWIGAHTESLVEWSERFIADVKARLSDAHNDMSEAFAYRHREWVQFSDLAVEENGLRLCRTRELGVAGPIFSYFVGEFAGGRLRRLCGITSAEARRLRFQLDVEDGRPVRVVATALSNGLVRLRVARRLPDREARALLLGWRFPTPKGEHPGITHHVFATETMPIVRRAFDGLGIVIEERFGAKGENP